MNFSSGDDTFNNSSGDDTFNNVSNETKMASTVCYVNDPFLIKFARVLAYSILLLVSLVGNTLVIALVSRYGRVRKTINFAVANMAVANLVITIVYMPRLISMFLIGVVWLAEGDFGHVLCKIVPFFHTVAIIVSVLTLLSSSLDTFCAVVFPMKNPFTTRVAKFTIFLTWILAIAARTPYLLSLRTKTSKGEKTCRSDLRRVFDHEDARDIYYTFLLGTFYAVPWLIIFILYLIIAIKLKTGKTPRQESATAERLKGLRAKATRKVMKMMIVITLVFLLCWIIYFLAQIAYSEVPCSFRFWRMFLAHSNCAINPILFAVFNTKVRRKFRAWSGNIFQKSPKINFYISPAMNNVDLREFWARDTINMKKLGETKRRMDTRRKFDNAVELGIVNRRIQEKYCDSQF